jgi:hypothetical protein
MREGNFFDANGFDITIFNYSRTGKMPVPQTINFLVLLLARPILTIRPLNDGFNYSALGFRIDAN